ncbi:MAG: hypothetical protein ACLR6I_14490 [Waltera sp.]
MRQVKTGAKLPETILRDVVIDSDQKRHEQERDKENSEKNREVRLLDVVLAERRVVICGELGAGKSTILSQAVLEIPDNNTTSLPILILAKELAEEMTEDRFCAAAICTSCNSNYCNSFFCR